VSLWRCVVFKQASGWEAAVLPGLTGTGGAEAGTNRSKFGDLGTGTYSPS
jgi:hypothetical protein